MLPFYANIYVTRDVKRIYIHCYIMMKLEVRIPHIAQNIAETCQKYFQSFIATKILQNILSQDCNFNNLKYF